MKIRTLISNQLYFGLEPIAFRRGAGRALQRVTNLPPERALLNAQTLSKDFRIDPAQAEALLETFVAKGLLQGTGCPRGEYRTTELFREYALARVVPPLTRLRAKELLDQACALATKINADWTHNPLVIHLIAVSGDYMSRHNHLSDLSLWPVVKRRREVTSRRFRSSVTTADGVTEIGSALRALSGFIIVHVVADKTTIERPFAVPFRDYGEAMTSPASMERLRHWGASLRQQLARR